MTTRRSYSASFKLSVVHELAGGTSAGTVAQRNGVTSSMVRKWSANRSELEAAVAQEGSKGQQLKLGTGRKPCHAAVDRALLQWVMKQKGIGERVKDTDMQEQARRCTSPLLDKWRDKIKHANFTPTASLSANDNCSASSPIASGYGLAIFAYMVEKHPQDLVGFDACGTIHDFVGFALCGHSVPAQNCMDTTDAYSWGGFDINTKTWNLRTVKALGLPAHMLPAVKAPGAVIGQTSGISAMLGLPSGKPVYLPMGDHPCAVMTAIAQTQGPADVNISRTSVLSIGSASQLAMVLTEEDAEQLKTSRGSCSLSFEVRPFLSENWFLGVAPSLSG
ncbi:hypothetical protein BBO99_00005652 [Phytophthora kernoviae]|uniref:Carbohydrate kinase FGGY N-terminal domain-containing protein n=2 Tax=Phytophthora kernoviae TaxID=325452 RepID=A0A3R7KIQ6_9STRA|nr:hypothetical protein G195_005564 [Phytophthora kernoviae 00238/432]KAG2519596.1 hypothetical protein JM16_006016 [Phytophthora kernoviae]KAG2520813.1 hypothetical protein JM18_006929 [Phytophthora kernoviae]RLN44946.1 hypothetical protein BBI17_005708 [Phytophthora kernoviae]RLN78884.1 hypothetical protein BBO99_00005652 [Phytophthora kernoviae]